VDYLRETSELLEGADLSDLNFKKLDDGARVLVDGGYQPCFEITLGELHTSKYFYSHDLDEGYVQESKSVFIDY
jgi:hypothetical protein